MDSLDKTSSDHFLSDLYQTLDALTSHCFSEDITCIRYGDGYVLYTKTDSPIAFENLINGSARLLAYVSLKFIPLRLAITQGDLKISHSNFSGVSITGSGWDYLREYEGALDWMGGWVYLPQFDGNLYETVKSLVSHTVLIKQQSLLSYPDWTFKAPFKKQNTYRGDFSWFINWYRVVRRPIADTEREIDAWWEHIPRLVTADPSVERKKENTKMFARYCSNVRLAAHLIYNSEISRDIDIGRIDKS